MNRIVGAVVGIFLAGIGTVVFADGRYAKKQDFDDHRQAQLQLELHASDDKTLFATKAELQLVANQSGQMAATLASIQAQLAAVQTDLTWMKTELMNRKR
jgi:hypothetical protein